MAADIQEAAPDPARASGRDLRDRLTILAIVLVVVVAKWPILPTPYHWDEMGAYFAPSDWLSERSLLDVLPGRHPAGTFFGHPPLLYLTVAALFKAP
jgi:hypothetical protein